MPLPRVMVPIMKASISWVPVALVCGGPSPFEVSKRIPPPLPGTSCEWSLLRFLLILLAYGHAQSKKIISSSSQSSRHSSSSDIHHHLPSSTVIHHFPHQRHLHCHSHPFHERPRQLSCSTAPARIFSSNILPPQMVWWVDPKQLWRQNFQALKKLATLNTFFPISFFVPGPRARRQVGRQVGNKL